MNVAQMYKPSSFDPMGAYRSRKQDDAQQARDMMQAAQAEKRIKLGGEQLALQQKTQKDLAKHRQGELALAGKTEASLSKSRDANTAESTFRLGEMEAKSGREDQMREVFKGVDFGDHNSILKAGEQITSIDPKSGLSMLGIGQAMQKFDWEKDREVDNRNKRQNEAFMQSVADSGQYAQLSLGVTTLEQAKDVHGVLVKRYGEGHPFLPKSDSPEDVKKFGTQWFARTKLMNDLRSELKNRGLDEMKTMVTEGFKKLKLDVPDLRAIRSKEDLVDSLKLIYSTANLDATAQASLGLSEHRKAQAQAEISGTTAWTSGDRSALNSFNKNWSTMLADIWPEESTAKIFAGNTKPMIQRKALLFNGILAEGVNLERKAGNKVDLNNPSMIPAMQAEMIQSYKRFLHSYGEKDGSGKFKDDKALDGRFKTVYLNMIAN